MSKQKNQTALPETEPDPVPLQSEVISDFDIKAEALARAVEVVAGYHGRQGHFKSVPDETVIAYARTFEAYLREDDEPTVDA